MLKTMNRDDIVRVLITAESIIVAGLLAWAQLWTKTYDIYQSYKPADPVWTVSLQLGGIYASVIAAVLSVILAFLSLGNKASKGFFKYAIGFAGCTITVFLFQVVLSLISTMLKAFQGATQWHPWLPSFVVSLGPRWTTLGMILVGVVLLCCWLIWWGPLLAKKLNV